MKRARVLDHWKHAYQNDYNIELLSLKIENVTTIGSIEIPLGKGISAITGLNGVGKSTILHIIWLCLCADAPENVMALDKRIQSGRAVLSFLHKSISYEVVYDFNSRQRNYTSVGEFEFPELSSTLVDLAEIAPTLQRYVRRDPNIQDLLEQGDGYTLSNEELGFVNYVMRRKYKEINIYEMEIDLGLDDNWGTFPYFFVERDDFKYGVEHLGLGELSGLIIFWVIFRKESNSVLLLDEPESYLSAQSQSAISDLFAYAASERAISIVLASHSDFIVSRIPPDRRVITFAKDGEIKCTNALQSPEHLAILGHDDNIKYVIIVEDNAAMVLLKEILTYYAPVPLRAIEICYAGCASKVVKAINGLFEGFDAINIGFRAVLDGDQRGVKHKCNKKLYYLPDIKDPEELVIEAISGFQSDSSTMLGVPEIAVTAAIVKNEGDNHHDWPFNFAREIKRPYEQVLETGARLYVDKIVNSSRIKSFVDDLFK